MRKKFWAEFIGTFALAFCGCGAIQLDLGSIAIPLVFGLVVMVMIYSVGHISGAHFNPAVTLGFTVIKRFPAKDLPFYWMAQFSGAFVALVLLLWIIPDPHGFGTTIPRVGILQAIVWELILTFFLMFVIVAVATDPNASKNVAGLAIGSTVALDAFVGGPLTGASMNPARSLAPAIVSGELINLWIYFFGPFLGASMAAICYEQIRD